MMYVVPHDCMHVSACVYVNVCLTLYVCSIHPSVCLIHLSVCLSDICEQVVAACCACLHASSPSGISLFPTLRATLLALLPKTEHDLEPFRSSVTSPCLEFEQRMNLFGFLSSDQARGSVGPLTSTVHSLGGHFLTARRAEILARARSLVLSDYHNTMLGTGDAMEDDTSSAGNIGDRQALLEQSGQSIS
jgi:hypothetical protein